MRPKIEIICPRCGTTALKDKAEVNRQTKKNNPVFCSKECAHQHVAEKRTIHHTIDKSCLNCGIIFSSTTHIQSRSCCSIKCAKEYSYKFVDSKKIAKSLKEYYQNNIHPNKGKFLDHSTKKLKNITTSDDRNLDGTYKLVCIYCESPFNHLNKYRKTCSDICNHRRLSTLCGGETNYKKFKYKDVWMDSSWEVELAEWFDDNDIQWIRDKKINFKWIDSTGLSRTYYPDFYLETYDIYVDPKNKFLQKKDKEKLDYVRNEYKITLLSGFLEEIKEKIIKMGHGTA